MFSKITFSQPPPSPQVAGCENEALGHNSGLLLWDGKHQPLNPKILITNLPVLRLHFFPALLAPAHSTVGTHSIVYPCTVYRGLTSTNQSFTF
jgi:hypothetical protein